jgi:RNA polymerase sigma factor (sigma-70 family)
MLAYQVNLTPLSGAGVLDYKKCHMEREERRKQLIEEHMHLAKKLVGRFIGPAFSYDDLVSEAYVAIVESADRALDLVEDGNYGAFFNNAIRWHLTKLVTRDKTPAWLEDFPDPPQPFSKPATYPSAKLRYRELLEQLQLSDKEIQILRLKLRGFSNVEVAERLQTHAVDIHRTLKDIGKRYEKRSR